MINPVTTTPKLRQLKMKFPLAFLRVLSVLLLYLPLATSLNFTHEDSILQQVTDATPYKVTTLTISNWNAPRKLLVFVPERAGRYPVVVFLHGFMLSPDAYSQLLTDISSCGFIIVAPELSSSLFDSDATTNIHEAAEVIEWLPCHLTSFFPNQLVGVSRPDYTKLVMMGHSKGGKSAFALALGKESDVSLPYLSALVALDPVDGAGGSQTKPPILTFQGPDEFDLPYPTLIVGTNLGPRGLVPCAPAEYGYKNFYKESSPAAFNFLPMEYGHMDFLNDWLNPMELIMVSMCERAGQRRPMREFTGKLVVNFLSGALFRQSNAFNTVFNHPSTASIKIAIPQGKGDL